jgi:predicted ATP-grasp superfamily ATP-dependent carboligase
VLAGVRALRAAGHLPWLAVTARGGYARRSRAVAGVVTVPDPAVDRDGYVAAVAGAAAHVGAAAVLPGTEVGLVALAGSDAAFGAGVVVGAGPVDVVARAVDKGGLAALAAAAGLRVPPTATITADRPDGHGLDFPLAVKPPRTMTAGPGGVLRSVAVRRVDSPGELRRAVESMPGDRWLVQPWLAGGLAAVGGVAWRGRLVAAVHQVADRIYPPGAGISAYARTVPADPGLAAGVAGLAAELGWSGLLQAQFVGDHLIDVNPRMYGSLALAVAAGLNLPAIWADLLLGRSPVVGAYRVGVRFRSEERDAGALAAAVSAGRWRAALAGLVPHRRTAHAVFSWRDPLPILRSVRQLAKGPGLVAGGHRRRG